MKNLMIYACLDTIYELPEYILYALQKLKSITAKIILISNRQFNKNDEVKLKRICDEIIINQECKSNFDLYKSAIIDIGFDEIHNYDSLLLVDNSCFGPIFDIKEVYNKMNTGNLDFWGIMQRNREIKRNRKYYPVLESSFLCFNKDILKSDDFKNFWKKIPPLNKNQIYRYETKLVKNLLRNKFTNNVYCKVNSYKFLSSLPKPEVLLNLKSPFLKKQSFVDFKFPIYLIDMIKNTSLYDINLIEEYFNNYYPPNNSILINNKSIIFISNDVKKVKNSIKTAIHLHVYYTDILIRYLEILKLVNIKIDIYITTDTEKKKNEIEVLFKEFKLIKWIKKIIICENRGRDILPWLKIKDYLLGYDLVGHFHTKKSTHQKDWITNFWMNDLLSLLFESINGVINLFNKNKNIGILIPDIPSCFLYKQIGWGYNKKNCIKFYNKIDLKKNIDLSKISKPIMPYGNMFWYKPVALQPLFDLNLQDEDFPKEPFPVDGTIAHAIERLPVYIAWSNGYDFRIALKKNIIDNRFLTSSRQMSFLIQIIEQFFWQVVKKIKLPTGLKRIIKIVIDHAVNYFIKI